MLMVLPHAPAELMRTEENKENIQTADFLEKEAT
jgi:hypothetical protein